MTAGKLKGEQTSRIVAAKPTLRNSFGKMLSAMLGRALQKGEKIDIDPLIGRSFTIMVAATESGATRVEAAMPAPGSDDTPF